MTEPSEIAIKAMREIERVVSDGTGMSMPPKPIQQCESIIQSAIEKATAGMVKREDVLPLVEALKECKRVSNNYKIRTATEVLDHAKAKGLM